MNYLYTFFVSLGVYGITAHTIIFELDDLLFTAQEKSSLVSQNTIAHYRNKLFDIIDTIKTEYKPIDPVYFKNRALPPAWCLYLLGEFDSKTMIEKVTEAIRQQTARLSIERMVLVYATGQAFNPEAEAELMLPVNEMHKLVFACAQRRENQLVLFANKTAQSMDALKKRYPDFFKLFKGNILTSSIIKQLKPSKKAYQALLDYYKLNPQDCYVIDTKREYLTSAEELGMTCFLCDRYGFKSLERQFADYTII